MSQYTIYLQRGIQFTHIQQAFNLEPLFHTTLVRIHFHTLISLVKNKQQNTNAQKMKKNTISFEKNTSTFAQTLSPLDIRFTLFTIAYLFNNLREC